MAFHGILPHEHEHEDVDGVGTNPAQPLDNPVWASLSGPHARFAIARADVLRYQPEVASFVGLPEQPGPTAWADLAHLAGPGAVVAIFQPGLDPPGDWEVVLRGKGVQMVGTGLDGAAEPEAVVLGPADVPEMLDLVARTKPGPFLPRTIELGTYLGFRERGGLIAMAGERLHPPGWTEISAVCTDPDHRGRGLATRLVRALGAGIRGRNEIPFLHAASTNTTAIRLYVELGFTVRRTVSFLAVRVPPD